MIEIIKKPATGVPVSWESHTGLSQTVPPSGRTTLSTTLKARCISGNSRGTFAEGRTRGPSRAWVSTCLTHGSQSTALRPPDNARIKASNQAWTKSSTSSATPSPGYSQGSKARETKRPTNSKNPCSLRSCRRQGQLVDSVKKLNLAEERTAILEIFENFGVSQTHYAEAVQQQFDLASKALTQQEYNNEEIMALAAIGQSTALSKNGTNWESAKRKYTSHERISLR